MKSYCSSLVLLLLVGNTFGQEENESKYFRKSLSKWERKRGKNSEDCKAAVTKAFKDFNEGKGRYYSIGDLSSWDVVYDKHMADKLKIEVESTGCVPDLDEECYNLVADFKLKEFYGNDIFEILKIGTDSLFQIGQGVEDAKYADGNEKLLLDIKNQKRIPPNFAIDQINKEDPIEVNLRFDIDTKGSIKNPAINLVRNTENNVWYEDDAIRILDNLGDLKPAIRFGKRVSSYKYITIVFGNNELSGI